MKFSHQATKTRRVRSLGVLASWRLKVCNLRSKNFYFILIAFIFFNYHQVFSQKRISVDSIKPMGLFDLNYGTTFRTAARSSETTPDQRQTNSAFGFSGRMQSSILWSLRSASLKKHRFTWGDILAAEVFAGKLSSVQPHESGNVWLAYQFDFGFGARYAINDQSEVGLNLILLRFSRDNVSGNISGSGLVGRYRYKKIMLEAGAIARHERALGVLTDVRDKVPMQGSWTLRYLVKGGKNFGLTAETLSGIYHQDEFQYSKMWTLKIFYGIYF